MSDKQESLILRKKILWAEIKAKEQEYGRLCKQVYELEKAKKDISFEVQKKIEESQEIADKLLEIEYKNTPF